MTMRIKLIVFCYMLAALAGALLYSTSYNVQELEAKLAGLNRGIIAEQEQIQVLAAEWTHLSEPKRIEGLASRHLNMNITSPKQVAGLRDMGRMVAMNAPKTDAGTGAFEAVAETAKLAAYTAPKAKTQAKPAVILASHNKPTYKTVPSTATPDRVKLLLASFQPSEVLTRE